MARFVRALQTFLASPLFLRCSIGLLRGMAVVVCSGVLGLVFLLWQAMAHVEEASAPQGNQQRERLQVEAAIDQKLGGLLGRARTEYDFAQQSNWITEIDLTGDRVSDAALADLGLERLERLRYLCLDSTRLTNAAMASVSRLSHLTGFHLGRTQISDAGLVPLLDLKRLRAVTLVDVPITDTGLAILSRVQGLEEVNLHGCKRITPDGLERFKKARPKCKVHVEQ